MTRTDLDLAGRNVGGAVRAVSDEFFAPGESLIRPGPATHDPTTFGPRGKVYDGWESRRARTPGDDWAVVALGLPGILHEIVVDTAFFRGNYPPEISVEAAWLDGIPDGALDSVEWTTVVPRSAAEGDSENHYPVTDRRIYTHVRLVIHPDGGVARLRVLGESRPDPRLLGSRVDLAALRNGGDVLECSNMFYSDARHIIQNGIARDMSEGWENARRRGPGNEYLVVKLAGAAELAHVDIDTSYFLGNAPGWASLSVRADGGEWVEAMAKRLISPDAHNRFRFPPGTVADQLRVDVYPDGGISRLHLYGAFAPDTLRRLMSDWLAALPSQAAGRMTAAGDPMQLIW